MELTQEQTKELFEKLKETLKLYDIKDIEIRNNYTNFSYYQMQISHGAKTYYVNKAYIKGFSLVFEMFDFNADNTALYGAENLIKQILNIL